MTLAVYAGWNRFSTKARDRITHHSFSFGPHLDPANLGFGPMICHNDDRIDPGGGYPDHPHTDLEIVTWVLEGLLLHTDDRGNTEALRPGDVQVMSAGSGVRHSEMADAASGPTRFLQTWITPDEPGTAPGWRTEHAEPGPGLTEIVGGAGLPIGTRGASLRIARLAPRDDGPAARGRPPARLRRRRLGPPARPAGGGRRRREADRRARRHLRGNRGNRAARLVLQQMTLRAAGSTETVAGSAGGAGSTPRPSPVTTHGHRRPLPQARRPHEQDGRHHHRRRQAHDLSPMAQDAVDAAVGAGLAAGPCVTATTALLGAAPRAELARLEQPAVWYAASVPTPASCSTPRAP
jgi:hypothetical protein